MTATAVVASMAMSGAAFGLGAMPAMAADAGVGVGPWTPDNHFDPLYAGTFTEQGQRVVCGEAGKHDPTGPMSAIGAQDAGWINANLTAADGQHPNVSPEQVAGLNRILSETVNTGDPTEAAALMYAVKSVLYPDWADRQDKGYHHTGSLDQAIRKDLSPSGADVGRIAQRAHEMIAAANSTPVGSLDAAPQGSGNIAFENDHFDANFQRVSDLVVNGNPGGNGVITLTGGHFDDGSTQRTMNIGDRATVVADTPTGQVTAHGDIGFSAHLNFNGYPATLNIFMSNAADKQNSLTYAVGASQDVTGNYPVDGNDPGSITDFAPKLTTSTSHQVVHPGEHFTDQVTFTDGGTHWPQAGNRFASVTAHGTVYGPFKTAPTPGAVPAGAPVAGHADVTTSAADGPGKPYTATTSETAPSSGYYSWVWTVDTGAGTAVPFYANGYSFTDQFGQAEEGAVTPTWDVPGKSKVTTKDVKLGEPLSDTLTLKANDHDSSTTDDWPKDAAGKPLTLHYTGRASMTLESESPAQPATPPTKGTASGIVGLGEVTIDADHDGTYTSPELPAIQTLDGNVKGTINWVWTLDAAHNPDTVPSFVTSWQDKPGQEDETQRIAAPRVSTKATPEAYVGRHFIDTATVSGPLPVQGADLHFELYTPKLDSNGVAIADQSNLVWTSSEQTVTKPGDYKSPEAPGQPEGDYWWVEVLTPHTPGTGSDIWRGRPNTPGETTHVKRPKVTTTAQVATGLGGTLTDTATIKGKLPDVDAGSVDLVFRAYRTPTGADLSVSTDQSGLSTPVKPKNGATPAAKDSKLGKAKKAADEQNYCSKENLLWTSPSTPVHKIGDYQSPAYTTDQYAQVNWVESLVWHRSVTDQNGAAVTNPDGSPKIEDVVIDSGKCGTPEETSVVVDVTTKAQSSSGSSSPVNEADLKVWDTAQVVGFVPADAKLVYDVYQVDQGQTPVCTDASHLTTLEQATAPAPGVYSADKPLEVKSAAYATPTYLVNKDVLFVESLVSKDGHVLHRGKCGDANEVLHLQAPPLTPPTMLRSVVTGGFPMEGIIAGAGGIAVLTIAAGAVVIIRRRRAGVVDES